MADKKKTGVVSRDETSKELLSDTTDTGIKQASTDSKQLASAIDTTETRTKGETGNDSSLA